MNVTCDCTAVTFKTPAPKPIDVYFCHCLQCRRQSATAFGTSAIFPADDLFPLSEHLKSNLQVWTRPTKSGGRMDCYFCRVCGCRILHRAYDSNGTPKPTVSIKGGAIIGLKTGDAKHIWTNSAVMPIPEGAEQWAESPPATPTDVDRD
ncbi:hypothetical protein CCHL11_05672 [Colletotrichum chlorophyti]|uniref:CENP-V/GFA domain-containing protein n=1 Tax=Colletotrichum chlorophyti TaxID=708187 RepID=A0A1Q8RTP0_9PEZI|nr:hypothetical protein CCHL11_05672 [Colletotrichum chlorophyti]